MHRFNLPHPYIKHFNNINIGTFHEMQHNILVISLKTFSTIKTNESLFISVWQFDLTAHTHDKVIFYRTEKIFTAKRDTFCNSHAFIIWNAYRRADKSLAQPTSLSIAFSVHGTGSSPTGPDPENRVCDQDIGSPGRAVSSGLQALGEPFPSWSG
jgi:hypothetical protein